MCSLESCKTEWDEGNEDCSYLCSELRDEEEPEFCKLTYKTSGEAVLRRSGYSKQIKRTGILIPYSRSMQSRRRATEVWIVLAIYTLSTTPEEIRAESQVDVRLGLSRIAVSPQLSDGLPNFGK